MTAALFSAKNHLQQSQMQYLVQFNFITNATISFKPILTHQWIVYYIQHKRAVNNWLVFYCIGFAIDGNAVYFHNGWIVKKGNFLKCMNVYLMHICQLSNHDGHPCLKTITSSNFHFFKYEVAHLAKSALAQHLEELEILKCLTSENWIINNIQYSKNQQRRFIISNHNIEVYKGRYPVWIWGHLVGWLLIAFVWAFWVVCGHKKSICFPLFPDNHIFVSTNLICLRFVVRLSKMRIWTR